MVASIGQENKFISSPNNLVNYVIMSDGKEIVYGGQMMSWSSIVYIIHAYVGLYLHDFRVPTFWTYD